MNKNRNYFSFSFCERLICLQTTGGINVVGPVQGYQRSSAPAYFRLPLRAPAIIFIPLQRSDTSLHSALRVNFRSRSSAPILIFSPLQRSDMSLRILSPLRDTGQIQPIVLYISVRESLKLDTNNIVNMTKMKFFEFLS